MTFKKNLVKRSCAPSMLISSISLFLKIKNLLWFFKTKRPLTTLLFLRIFDMFLGMVLVIYWVWFSCWFSVVLVQILLVFWGWFFCYFWYPTPSSMFPLSSVSPSFTPTSFPPFTPSHPLPSPLPYHISHLSTWMMRNAPVYQRTLISTYPLTHWPTWLWNEFHLLCIFIIW